MNTLVRRVAPLISRSIPTRDFNNVVVSVGILMIVTTDQEKEKNRVYFGYLVIGIGSAM